MVETRIHSMLDTLTVVVTFCLQADNMRRMHRDLARDIDIPRNKSNDPWQQGDGNESRTETERNETD